MNEKPWVKTYAGGKPNYCTPVDAVNMSQECVDETVKDEHMIDCTDEQLMEEVRRRGFVIRDAQVGKEWVGLTHDEVNSWELPDSPTVFEFAQFVEAKLKEKNT